MNKNVDKKEEKIQEKKGIKPLDADIIKMVSGGQGLPEVYTDKLKDALVKIDLN